MMLVTAVTLGEHSFGPHATDDPMKRAGRVTVLQHVEAIFDPLPYDQGSARLFGQICATVRASGREPGKRASDPMVAATAASNELPLYTANPDDFKGAEVFVRVIGLKHVQTTCELIPQRPVRLLDVRELPEFIGGGPDVLRADLFFTRRSCSGPRSG